jgi:hypothetical protein
MGKSDMMVFEGNARFHEKPRGRKAGRLAAISLVVDGRAGPWAVDSSIEVCGRAEDAPFLPAGFGETGTVRRGVFRRVGRGGFPGGMGKTARGGYSGRPIAVGMFFC